MPEDTPIEGNVLGVKLTRGEVFGLRDMLASPAWEVYSDLMQSCVKGDLIAVLGGVSPTSDELHALSGAWKTTERATAHFLQAVDDAVHDVKAQEAANER